MKWVKQILVIIVLISFFPINTLAKEKINVYVFKKEGCNYCENALSFFNAMDEEYKSYFNLVVKDVKESDTNVLLKKIVNYFKINMKGVPLIVIGNQTFEGFNDDMKEKIKSAIKTNYENESADVVLPLMTTSKTKENSSSIIWIILAIIVGIFFLWYIVKDDKKVQKK